MDTIKRILVPLDFSDCSMAALRYALNLARDLGGSIEVLHVWEQPAYIGTDLRLFVPEIDMHAWGQSMLEKLKIDLDAVIAGLGELGSLVTSRLAITGNPAHAIVKAANGGEFDLVVMGTHGRTGLARLFMGSVAQKVVRGADCPVLTVSSRKRKGRGIATAA